MTRKKYKNLSEKYPASESCACEICQYFCTRPGWWTVEEAANAIDAGYAYRMMLEMSPKRDFGVLSPAFRGNEGELAIQDYAKQGCTFFDEGQCELYATGLMPLECRVCHHEKLGIGQKCHYDLEKQWQKPDGKRLIVQWGNLTGFWLRQGYVVKER